LCEVTEVNVMDVTVSEARGVSVRWHQIPLYQRILAGVVLGVLAGWLLGPRGRRR
jgi:Na+/H+-dicarboxylate symporter